MKTISISDIIHPLNGRSYWPTGAITRMFAFSVVLGASAIGVGCGSNENKIGDSLIPIGGTSVAGGAAYTIAGSGASAGKLAGTSGSSGTVSPTGQAGAAGKAAGAGSRTAGAGGSSSSTGAAGFDATHAQPGCKVAAFELGEVTLEKSDFTANRDRTLAMLSAIDIESLLYNFRTTVGLPTNGATPPGGESWERPDSTLRGHGTGHVLKALAQAYASTGDQQYKTKVDKLVAELKKCQDLSESKGFGAGYLSAYPPDQFIQLETITQNSYPAVWAPYYTLHKILAGLIASYQFTGNETALDIAKKLGKWVNNQLSKLPHSQLQRMWAIFSSGETGGMNEALTDLYDITGDKLFLDTAALFDSDFILNNCSANQDKLSGLHANTYIPTVTGYMRMYQATKSDKYLKTAQNFWSIVTTNHMYVIGGTGGNMTNKELWGPPGQIASTLTNNRGVETCATHNMLKLTRQLFCFNPDAKYMDYYERGLYNHILGSQDPTSSDAAVTYFMPLVPGAARTYKPTSLFTCCNGTGMENHTKYQEQIYSYAIDGTTLYVNLYIPSTLTWSDKGFKVAQATDYPYEPSSKLTFEGTGPLKVALRIPAWATDGVKITVNGEAQNAPMKTGTYAVIDRTWTSGDTLELTLPFKFRIERTPDDPNVGSILYGPLVMVAMDSTTTTMTLNVDESQLDNLLNPATPLTYTMSNITYEAFFKATNATYHTYFRF
jgi:uncharacterized protein